MISQAVVQRSGGSGVEGMNGGSGAETGSWMVEGEITAGAGLWRGYMAAQPEEWVAG